MAGQYAVVDLFSGPGGLGEGFSSVMDEAKNHVFDIRLSIEMDAAAHSTLRLRSFLRHYRAEHGDFPPAYYEFLNDGGEQPDWSVLFPIEWHRAEFETQQIELGRDGTEEVVDERIDRIHTEFGNQTVLIGGPPCQAYSLVGRARNRGIKDYSAHDDLRHFLYREYIRILARLRPAVFVMENVKGMLSSQMDGSPIFDRIIADLRQPDLDAGLEYDLIPIAARRSRNGQLSAVPVPQDFIVRAEEHGVPQARHRVIIVGVRRDLANKSDSLTGTLLGVGKGTAVLSSVLDRDTYLRSGISRHEDSGPAFRAILLEGLNRMARMQLSLAENEQKDFLEVLEGYRTLIGKGDSPELRRSNSPMGDEMEVLDELKGLNAWIRNSSVRVLANHETRSHIPADLERYLFAAVFAEAIGRSPKARDFPEELAPNHRNWQSGKFADRFRVQLLDKPATTITSHISKDGHYFIHPDPMQCRSLTVREAARLQTFPDDYLFLGNRTQQYHQVGNAVPPYLAYQIGQAVAGLIGKTSSD